MTTHSDFMDLFAEYLTESRDLIELAYILSKDAHRSQTRIDGERYFEHPRRVALVLTQELGCTDRDMICAALLHDVVEDTKYLTVIKLGRWFGDYVASMVDALTKRPGRTQRTYFEMLQEYPNAAIVKGCDRLDNLRSLAATDRNFQWKQIHGTQKFVIPMLTSVATLGGWEAARAEQLLTLIKAEIAHYPALGDRYYVGEV